MQRYIICMKTGAGINQTAHNNKNVTHFYLQKHFYRTSLKYNQTKEGETHYSTLYV